MAQVVLDCAGRMVRGQESAHTVADAVHRLPRHFAGCRLALPAPEPLAGKPSNVPVVVDSTSLPVFTLPEAIRAIGHSDASFLPFVAIKTGRGAVLYRPFDGRLGVVTSLW